MAVDILTWQSKPETGATSKSGSIAILVDCGIAQGHDPLVPFDRFPVPPAEIDFLFLTHAHIDHIGRVPELIHAGFYRVIICTPGTKALLLTMLQGSGRIRIRLL